MGEIEDETDPGGGAVRRLANGDWYVRGDVSIERPRRLGIELPVDTDAYNSVGGYVFAELGRLPKRGDAIAAGASRSEWSPCTRTAWRRCASASAARLSRSTQVRRRWYVSDVTTAHARACAAGG